MKDMTKGNPLKLVIEFAIPMLIASIFQQVYSLVDTLIVGRYLGSEALAGVGSTGTLTFLILCLALGIANGGGLIISQCFGSKDVVRMRKTIIAMAWTMGILAIVMSVVGYCYSPTLLRLLRVPDNCIDYSIQYLRIIFAFTGGTILYNFASAIMRSTGDSKTPLYALIISSFVNVALDLIFIIAFKMGVTGAAIATVISQFIAGFICLGDIIFKKSAYGFTSGIFAAEGVRKIILPEKRFVLSVIKTSIPSTFQSSMISIGGIAVQRLINSFGSDVMAGYVAANRLDSLAIQVILAVGNGLCVFTGQNIGSGSIDRIRIALKQSRVVMLICAFIIAVSAYVFRYEVMGLFLDKDTSMTAITVGADYLSIIGVAYLICAVMQSYQNVIRGAGDVNTCMVAGLTELAGRIIFAYLLSSRLGYIGIWIATPISWGCGCIIPVVRYYSGKWQGKKLI